MIAAAPTHGIYRQVPAGNPDVDQAGVAVYGARLPAPDRTETSEHIRPRASLTERARREACRRVGQDGNTVARVTGHYGLAGRRS